MNSITFKIPVMTEKSSAKLANDLIAMLCITCSQNMDLKCNRVCKLPVFSFCLGTFYDPF